MAEDTWQMLLDRLQERNPDFVDRFLTELRTRAFYDPDTVPADDLARTAGEAMLLVIERLRGGEVSRHDIADSLGRRRARQGVPLERLIAAIRLDLRITWQLLLEIAQPDYTGVLVQNVERLITVVDGYVSDVQEAFLRELAVLQRDSRLATEQHLSKLFNAQDLSQALLDDIATGIGVSAESRFELLMLPSTSAEHRGREVAAWLAKREVLAYVFRGRLLLFRVHSGPFSSWRDEFARVPSVYVDRVEGLHNLPVVARAASDLQSLAGSLERLVCIEEFWAIGAASHLQSLIPGCSRSILAPLSDLADDERERVLSTVRVFLRSGSVKETASLANCHRNTVINRFKTFQGCTGLDITVPSQAALAFVLLAGEAGELAPPVS